MPSRVTLWRRNIMDTVFSAEMREAVLAEVAGGVPLAEAMAEYGLSDEVAYGRGR